VAVAKAAKKKVPMTLPDERSRAVKYARQFLVELLDPKATPRVPSEIRKRAHRVLRHFPHDLEIEMAAEQAPDVFGKETSRTSR
jgi:hypothetical protein